MYHPEKGKGHAALTAHVATIGDAPLWVAGGFQFSEVPALPLVPGRWPFSVHLLPALWPVEVLPVSPRVHFLLLGDKATNSAPQNSTHL